MSDPAVTRAFLLAEIEALEPFGFVAVSPAGHALQLVEVTRLEDGRLEVRVPGRPPMLPALPVPVRAALHERGFASSDAANQGEPWTHAAADAAAAVDLVGKVFTEVFEAKADATLDVAHGSHRAEHEARQKLAATRPRIERVLTQMNAGKAPEQDADGDYMLALRDVHVKVAPRVTLLGPVVVRVFAVTNVGVHVVPELGLFLARLNFGLMFGRFALDAEHAAIWFDETLLGEHITDEELRFTIEVVASTADEWDDKLKQMFGGATYQEVQAGRARHETPPTKPGGGGYL
ncbi:MAG: hypothetical protein DCC71_23255 [Proteobacteria bacterium]|nr:MAG: hypothetical protein DCC71_23255 [Pseudomonadota bacterium]